MLDATNEMLAVSDKRAKDLAGISMRQLRYWEQIGLVVPSIQDQISTRNTVRLYTFQNLLELLVVAELRHRPEITLQHIRRVVAHLREQNFAAPLRELKFATRGNEIYFQHPDGSWSGGLRPDQVVFSQALALNVVSARISAAHERDPATAGKVVKRRGVHGSKPIFAGTRVTVGAVQRYLEAGYSTDAIIDEYPSLTPADVEAARRYTAAS